MIQCDVCKKNIKKDWIKTCGVCKSYICEDCSYSLRFYRKYKEQGLPDQEKDETTYFCRIHFIELIKGFFSEALEDAKIDHYIIKGSYIENKQEVEYLKEFRGKNLGTLIKQAVEYWPSAEWKDWNTM